MPFDDIAGGSNSSFMDFDILFRLSGNDKFFHKTNVRGIARTNRTLDSGAKNEAAHRMVVQGGKETIKKFTGSTHEWIRFATPNDGYIAPVITFGVQDNKEADVGITIVTVEAARFRIKVTAATPKTKVSQITVHWMAMTSQSNAS